MIPQEKWLETNLHPESIKGRTLNLWVKNFAREYLKRVLKPVVDNNIRLYNNGESTSKAIGADIRELLEQLEGE